jgi:ribosomal protein S6--L-glutamate ligase
LQILAREGVGLPVTAFANESTRTDEVLEIVGGAPVVIKLLEGTQGIGVVLGETHKSAKSVIEAFHGADIAILVQEFIKEAEGRDIRAFVVGRKIVATMERVGAKGDFRSNLHRGGTATEVKLTPVERAAALKAARAMGLNVAGVDLLRSKRGPVVMEVNSSPGLEGIEKTTTVDVATAIIDFLEKNAKPGKTRTRGKG